MYLSTVLCILILSFIQLTVSMNSGLREKVTDDEMRKCKEETNYSLKDEKDFQDGKPPSHEQFCYYKCLLESLGILKDGKFEMDKAKVLYHRGNLDEKITKCVESLTITTCEDIQKLEECLPDE